MPVKIQLDENKIYGDWRDALARDGYAIVKGAIPRDRAAKYRQSFFDWYEKFGLGFKQDDPSTWVPETLPVVYKGGLIGHSIAHESFMWEIRQEPGLIAPYSLLYGTDGLLVSFDGENLALPGKMQDFKHENWAHNDQSPFEFGLTSVQGIANLNDNGPEDGGLVVLKGSHRLFDEFFGKVWKVENEYLPGGKMHGVHGHTYKPDGIKWYEDQGLKYEKICVDAGDLILWDSRTVHYNVPPTGARDRCCAYVCYEPASAGSPEQLKKKQTAFEQREQCSHIPISQVSVKKDPVLRDGVPCKHVRTHPFDEPKLTTKLLKLAGIVPYQVEKEELDPNVAECLEPMEA